MFRDFAIVATAFGADLDALKRAGWVGALSVVQVVLSFAVELLLPWLLGFRTPYPLAPLVQELRPILLSRLQVRRWVPTSGDRIECCCGPSQGDPSYGGNNWWRAVSAWTILKRLSFMRSYGYHKGVAAGLAATDPKLVPYGAMTATFYTGVGCLLAPSLLYLLVLFLQRLF